MEALIRGLRTYAREQVEANRARLVANLSARRAEAVGGQAPLSPLVLDVALPGAAYFSVAAGGLAEVLHVVGEEHVRVDRFLGASGGACSLFLILANQREQPAPSAPSAPSAAAPSPGIRCPSSELLLRSYLEYGESEGSGSVSRTFNALLQSVGGVSSFWENKYAELLRDAQAFKAVQEHAFVAVAGKPLRRQMLGVKPTRSKAGCMAGKPRASQPGREEPLDEGSDPEDFEATSDNYLFHDFESVEQAVQAFVATGEATAKGFFRGISVLGSTEPRSFTLAGVDLDAGGRSSRRVRLGYSFCDGGHPVAPQLLPAALRAREDQVEDCSSAEPDRSANALLYYHTWFNESSDALFCTPQSVERLFKIGVDRTIECLCSPTLAAPETSPASQGPPKKPAPDGMVVVLPGAPLPPALSRIGRAKDLGGGAFVSLRGRRVIEV